MNKAALVRISELTINIATIDDRLAMLRDYIRQITYDNVQIDIGFAMHNQDQHDKNEADELTAVDGPLHGYPMAFTSPFELLMHRQKQQKACRVQFAAKFTEGNAILIINIFYQQEVDRQNKLREELKQILEKQYTTVVAENPIHARYTEE